MITILTSAKPFKGQAKIAQGNAIRSWTMLRPACEVILFGDEEGAEEFAKELGIRQIKDIERNESGLPLISAIFRRGQEIARHNIICYINADIIVMSDFIAAVQRANLSKYLMVGQRHDMDVNETLEFSSTGWEENLRRRVEKEGRLHGITGIDYFIFPKGTFRDIPPMAVGRPGWDNWLIYNSRMKRIPVINATSVITVVHQNHGHASFSGGEKAFWEGPEAIRNIELAGGRDNMFHIGFADRKLTPRGLKRACGWRDIYFKFRALPVLHRGLRFLLPLFKIPGKAAGLLQKFRNKTA
jgi:hypothetical protein